MIQGLYYAYPKIPMELLKESRVIMDRLELLKLLPKNKVVAEVGVALGEYSQEILNTLDPVHFVAIDLFDMEKYDRYGDTDLKEVFGGKTHFGYYAEKFMDELIKCKMEMRRGLSWEVIAEFPNEYFDIVYLDADHSYESAKKDLNALRSKIKPGGIIACDDYDLYDLLAEVPSGVPRAVHEFIVENNCDVLYFVLEARGFYNIAFRVGKNV